MAQGGGSPGDALAYSRGFLITGDYAVGGVDLREELHIIENGFSTAPIPMGGVPANADILAAYLFWETVTTGGDAWETEAAGVKFRGFDIDVTNVLSAKRTAQPSAGAACYGSGSLTMQMFQADVLRFLPVKVDDDGKPTGKRIVNDADLIAQDLDPHTVTLPVRDGNGVPESAGASLAVVYRDVNPNAPLKKVVIYTGNKIKPEDTALNLTIKGIYGSASTKSAKITHILSSGQPNSRLRFSFAGAGEATATQIGTSPFSEGPASQRWWANPTVDVSSLMHPEFVDTGVYGETVSTSIFHTPGGAYDCVALGAVVFSTAIQDLDKDGLPDTLEDASSSLTDADGGLLPDLNAMGAGSEQADIFIEVNAMKANMGTTYGSPAAPYDGRDVNPVDGNPDVVSKTDPLGHNHMPTPYALKLVGDAFDAHDIRVHFDVGPWAAYHGLGIVTRPDFIDDYTSTEANSYLIPTAYARGGEVITEVACDPAKPSCHFPDYPGTVPWKLGLQAHRDAPVDDAGIEMVPTEQTDTAVSFVYLDPDGTPSDNTATWNGRRRFDPERRGLFKYLLYAHARGNPKSLPCLIDGQPAPYLNVGDTDGADPDTGLPSCDPGGVENEDFEPANYHVPTSASGVAELPGGNFMVTMGMWDEFVGRPFARASTTFHELGHTLGLFHGGPETTTTGASWQPGAISWGNPSTATWVEANCKPNYLSSMSYLFQIHGLFDSADQIHLDYSWAPRAGLTEESLSDGALLPGPTGIEPAYQPAWFAPADSPLAFTLGVPAAKRYCTGARFGDPLPIPWARVHPELAADDIDWDGDPDTITATNHDANFDNALTSLGGFSDWDNIRLNQTGAVVTGVTAGSAEGLYFDNAGTFNGAFFDSSGAFFDASGAWFDASGTWFDNAGGVFWDSAGAFFDAAGQTPNGVYFHNSGAWFDNFGGAWFDNVGGAFFDAAGGVYFDNANGVYFDNANGAFFDAASGSSNEVTYETSLSFGRGRPHKAATCVIDETTGKPVNPADGRICSTAAAFEPDYHRIEVHFEQLQVGGISAYEIQRKSTQALANTPDATFATAGTVAAHLVTFTDPAELADGVVYTYRVRGLSADEFGNSGWARSVTETAVNVAPEAADDGPYTVAAGSMLTVSESEGVLTNDREIADVDSPATSRSVFSVVTNPEHGELAMNADGSFTYTPEAGYVGPDSFQYVADNGPWSGDPENVRLSPPSNTATVSINVTNDPPSCAATLTASVLVGSTTLLTHNCSDPNGQTLLVTGAGPVTGGGSVALTNPVSASFSFTAPTTATTATFTYTVSDGIVTTTGNATITVTLPPPYGFVNVQNLPPPANKTQKTGSTVPMKWQWTQNGVPVNTVNQAMVRAYACNASPLAPGTLVGVPFTPAQPGSGNSFSYTASNNTWTFSWKLWYSVNGVLTNLPVGTYVVQVQNSVTQQKDPVTVNTCGTLTIPGALITVVK